LIILFKDNPSIITPVVITEVVNATTARVSAALPSATNVQAEMPLTQGAAWIVKSVPSPRTLTVESAPTSNETCSPCTGTLTVAHDARDVEVINSKFVWNSLADVAPVNSRRVLVANSFFGPRRHCTAGSWIDIEPNRYTDSSNTMSVVNNVFDARGSGCNQATAWGGISMGSASGKSEHILIQGNITRGSTLGSGVYGGGNLTKDTFQMQQFIHLWQGRDISVVNNHIDGYYNWCFEAIGYGPTERLFFNGNNCLGDGNMARLVNTRYSQISNNRYEWRHWTGGAAGQPTISITEVGSSGHNYYFENRGVSNYALVPGGGSVVK
jgi:hypothetical protein